MKDYRKEVSKDYYDQWTKKIAEGRHSAERERFSVSILDGYGLYGWELYERDGKFYESYSIGDSCD